MFEQVLAGMSDGIMVLDREGRILYANPALFQILSLAADSLAGKRPLEAVRLPELAELIDRVSGGGAAERREMTLIFPAEKTLLVEAYPAADGLALLVRDVSELKYLENLRREFVANVSHELKTPLTAIQNYTETLLGGAIDDPAHNRKFLGKIEKNARALAELIDDILEVSRLEARRGIAAFHPFHLEEEVERALETLAGRIKEKKLAIIKSGGHYNECEVSGEPGHVYRALLNLLDNAVKYSPPGGAIELACSRGAAELRLSVQDHGPGIPAEHQERIFERFYRVDKARSRELGGTGLGLAIVKHIMEIHGGRVELESMAGQGAKFTLVFPTR